MWLCVVMYIAGTCGRLWSSIKIAICVRVYIKYMLKHLLTNKGFYAMVKKSHYKRENKVK